MANDTVASLAVSLDGYIAEADGGVEFLEKYPADGFDGFDFEVFVAGIGALIMGSTTYRQAVDWGWEWGDLSTTVLTSRTDLAIPDGADVRFSAAPTAEAIRTFAAETPHRLWVFGGGEVITEGILGGAVETLDLMVIPEALGSGLPLFTKPVSVRLTVRETTSFPNGALRIVYDVGGQTS